jgi:hypothetical protein
MSTELQLELMSSRSKFANMALEALRAPPTASPLGHTFDFDVFQCVFANLLGWQALAGVGDVEQAVQQRDALAGFASPAEHEQPVLVRALARLTAGPNEASLWQVAFLSSTGILATPRAQ